MPRKKWPGTKIYVEPPITLQKLVDDYLYTKRYFKYAPEKCTFKEDHERYLESLNGHADFICGEPGNTLGVLPYTVNTHQRYFRFPSRQLLIEPNAEKLMALDGRAFESFEELYAEVLSIQSSKKLPGFGRTTIYDYALRWGWHASPRVQPRDFVYVHATPGKAAMALWERGYLPMVKDIEKAVKAEFRIPLEYFPEEIRNSAMSAADVEHFLCCYDALIYQLPKNNLQNK